MTEPQNTHPEARERSQAIIERTFVSTLTLAGKVVHPTVGFFQPTFPLTEADFLRLQQRSPVLAAIGGVLLTFGATFILDKFVDARLAARPLADTDWWIALGAIGGGIVSLFGSYFFSRPQSDVRAKIKQHFRANPGTPGIEVGDEPSRGELA